MGKFKVGDRVENVSNITVPIGDHGTVMFVDKAIRFGNDHSPVNLVGVAWDKFDHGHNFEGERTSLPFEMLPKHGWNVSANDIKLLEAPEIDIKLNTNYDINPAELCESLTSILEKHGVGLTFKNGNTLEVTKEIKNMRNLEFKTEESFRIDKSCNKKIPTIKTTVSMISYPWHDGVATCDKADYSERQGVIEALANLFCDGNFDREFNKAAKANVLADKKARTCSFCGKVFDTVEEKAEHEAWHIECKKARRERYLLRKRAKEIAFEEQAQKIAKDMLKEKPNE